MKTRTGLLLLLLSASLLASCGGSDGPGLRSRIEGTWRGELQQGIISCTNGVAVGAGSWSVAWRANMTVTGSDEAGSRVQAVDGACVFEGTRDARGFQAQAVTGCPQGMVLLKFELLADDQAVVAHGYDINLVPKGSGDFQCKTSPSGLVNRDPAPMN